MNTVDPVSVLNKKVSKLMFVCLVFVYIFTIKL